MRVQARCFAVLREVAVDRTELELPDGAQLADAWSSLAERFPGLAP
jgi:molybdopterin converting factor small subunit